MPATTQPPPEAIAERERKRAADWEGTEEVAPFPSQGVRLDDLKAQIRSSLEYWRDLLSRNNVQGFACDMLEDFDSLVNPVREGK